MWIVLGFLKGCDDLVADLALSEDFTDDMAVALSGGPYMLVGATVVTPEIAADLQSFLPEPIDLERADYFLEWAD